MQCDARNANICPEKKQLDSLCVLGTKDSLNFSSWLHESCVGICCADKDYDTIWPNTHEEEKHMFRILVAEDDLPLQKMMCAFLKLNGYQPIPASDGVEALEAIDHILPDLAIIDVMMPRKNGWEVTKEIRSMFPMLPILMVTAKDTLEDKRIGFASGADDYLTKPVDLDEMLLHVQALMRRANAMTSHKLQVGKTVLDYDALTVSREDYILSLPKKELSAL